MACRTYEEVNSSAEEIGTAAREPDSMVIHALVCGGLVSATATDGRVSIRGVARVVLIVVTLALILAPLFMVFPLPAIVPGLVDPLQYRSPYLLGTLGTDPNRASQEYAAGLRVAEQTVSWKDYEPQEGVFNSQYIAEVKWRIQTFRRAGLKVVLSPAIHYPPPWVFELPGSHYVNQYGVSGPRTWAGGFEEPNVVFSQPVRDHVARFEVRLMQDVGPDNVWAVRYGNGSLGEAVYPDPNDGVGHENSYWAFDANAQGNSSGMRPSTLRPNPYPAWRPGQRTYHGRPFSAAEVREWYDWYVDARIDFVNWHTKLYRDMGYTGYLDLLTPGVGVRPAEYSMATANFLDGTGDLGGTMGRGALWTRVYAGLASREKVVAYVSSMADGSGDPPDQGCEAADAKIDMDHDRRVENWSAARYISYLANKYDMTKSGENPGAGDPHRTVLYGPRLLDRAIAQMVACSFRGMFWAHDENLYDGRSGVTLDQLASIARPA